MDRSVLKSTLVTVIVALVIAIAIHLFLFQTYTVDGTSMEPGLVTGDRVMVNKTVTWSNHYTTGEIIVFKSPIDPQQTWIKRVIGVPGDTISVKTNVVYINGKRYPEPFLKYRQSMNVSPRYVPPGYLWVEGDNRPVSFDSRYFGLLPEKNVRGQAFVIWWPLGLVRWLS